MEKKNWWRDSWLCVVIKFGEKMSRIGKMPIIIPEGVSVNVNGSNIKFEIIIHEILQYDADS